MKYLGIDFGLRRVGLAVSEGILASPFKTLNVRGVSHAITQVISLAKEQKIEKIIVGLPEGKIGKTVLGFIKALKKSGLDVYSADETLSTKHAQKRMIDLGIPKEKRQSSDAYSAAAILQNWLDDVI